MEMEKQRKWQFFLILTVIALTVYNILPTVFYYSQPLKDPIQRTQAEEIATAIQTRANQLESESKEWLSSFCEMLNLKPTSIALDEKNPQFFAVSFLKQEEARKFRSYLPRSGALIPFVPAQLALPHQEESSKEVIVQRRVPIHFDAPESLFDFAKKDPKDSLYRELILDRAAQIALTIGGPSESAMALASRNFDYLASQINTLSQVFEESVPPRFAAAFTQGPFSNKSAAIQSLITAFDTQRDQLKKEKGTLSEENLRLAEQKESSLIRAKKVLKKQEAHFAGGQDPWDLSQIEALLKEADPLAPAQTLSFGNRSPYFSDLVINWAEGQIFLKLHQDVANFREALNNKDLFEQLLINEVAKITRSSEESILPTHQGYALSLHKLPETSGCLVLDLEKVAQLQMSPLLSTLKNEWNPQHVDLQALKIVDYATYQTLSSDEQALALIVSTPHSAPPGLRNNSLYVIAKGIDKILQNYESFPDSEQAQVFSADFKKLADILRQNGFLGYRTSLLPSENGASTEFVFEKSDFYRPLLAATREDFSVNGTQKYAYLELSNLEQRLAKTNQIENQIHEDLLKWKDEYQAAQISLNPLLRYDVPKPTHSAFWDNLKLSLRKFFRGDEKRVIRWGLDLSGGKTVQIELRDANNQVVKNEADIKQGINELYNRVNKMGVSEVSIRQLGNHIVLDFPGSQSLSAAELIQSSSMYFHLVNEKFSSLHSPLAESAHHFLQEVWNEAIVSNRKDPQSLNLIAWKHLHGDSPRSEAAQMLLQNGLQLASPDDCNGSHSTDDDLCKIGILRGANPSEWHGQSHPLLFIFRNFALEGAQLEQIRSNYDPSKGNYLSFEVTSSATRPDGTKIYPSHNLHAWTSKFSKEKILGTTSEIYTPGRGWRMAVLLNDTIINAPTLDSALKDSAMISGQFSQREVNQLASDLKAGSLTFTPHILSEKNVSPELGQSDRAKGIVATLIALALVIGAMILYYRFAGFVASVAVLFNLLIIWAIYQNLGATLSLAGIAGIILNMGMAVDANVLVFERMKEEFAISGRIASAITSGYQKAYSAIIDSNVTTVIAALILLNFDAGPIKAFAITLIIGIASSMFTALFMTRYYFTGWAQNPKHRALNMSHWIKAKKIDFLKRSKLAFAVAAAIILVGGSFVYTNRSGMFGMDFTGGFSVDLELAKDPSASYVKEVENALSQNGISHRDFQVRELNPSNQLRILLGTSMEEKGKPFYSMPLEKEKANSLYSYERNPRIDWVVQALQNQGLSLTPRSLSELDSHWTLMSGQMSDSMRNNAALGLLIAFVCIFIYITFRFEYKFAAAAIVCLLHDVFITLGFMGLLYMLGVPIQIDLNTIAALMTIIGYSLNDTIIIFDRIREEMSLTRNKPLSQIVNSALNATLSRTTITSGTTLLVLIALVALGGPSIFSFALVMTIGVFFGTLSSWYIAAPLMLFFHGREEKELTQQAF
jgi:SecD/SecF fusion protein